MVSSFVSLFRLGYVGCLLSFFGLTGCHHTKTDQTTKEEQSLIRIATSMKAQRNYKTAYNFYEQVLETNPRNLAAHEGLIDLALDHNDPRDAFKQYQLAVEYVGTHKSLDMKLFRIYMALNDLENAQKHALYLTETYPQDAQAWRLLGTIYDSLQDHSQAQNAYEQSLAIDPHNVKTKSNLGLSLTLSGDVKQGVEILGSVMMNPRATHIDKHNYVIALVLDGRTEDAELLLAEDMSPKDRQATIQYLQSLNVDMKLTPDTPFKGDLNDFAQIEN